MKTINIDYTDWYTRVMKDEEIVQTKEDIFALLDRGKMTSAIAQAAIVSREEGLTTEKILKSNKMLLLSGAMSNVASVVKGRKQDVRSNNGKKYQIPEYIGKTGRRSEEPKEEDDLPTNYQKTASDNGLKLAENYLTKVIPGHIFNHLLIIRENGGDVKQVADQLKKSISSMLVKLK